MLGTFRTLLAIRIASAANRIIYYAQRLPLIGKRIGDDWYASLPLKRAAAVVALIVTIVWGFLTRAWYVGLLVYTPAAFYGDQGAGHGKDLFLHIFFLLSFLVGAVNRSEVFEPKKEKYIAVKLMRMPPSRYMKAALGYRYATFFVFFLPSLLLFGSLAGLSLVQAALLAAAVTLWRIGGEYAHLRLFAKTGIVLIRKTVPLWIVILAGNALAYAPLVLDWPAFAGMIALHPLFLILTAAAGVYAVFRLARYGGYAEAVDTASRRDEPLFDLGRAISEAQKADVRLRDDDLADPDMPAGLGGAAPLPSGGGYARLNAIFFARHRRVIARPFNRRLAIVGGVGAVLIGAAVLLPDTIGPMLARLRLSMLAMVFFSLAVGERICRALFYNCDISLMRYGFYRRDAAAHFRIRLGRVALQNAAIGAAVCAVLTAALLASGSGAAGGNQGGGPLPNAVDIAGMVAERIDSGDFPSGDAPRGDAAPGRPLDASRFIMLWACGLALSVFFSVHYLFTYYIFQPYTTELNAKNPFYHIIHSVVSGICGACLFLRIPDSAFTVAVVALTALYVGIALLLVRKYGSRTFRVK